MNISSKVRAGVATAALAAVVVGGVAVAANITEDDLPVLEQTTVAGDSSEVVEATTTVLEAATTVVETTWTPTTTVDVVETTVAPVETVISPTAAPTPTAAAEPPSTTIIDAPAPTVPEVVGLSRADAIAAIDAAGLGVLFGNGDCDDPAVRDTHHVRWQRPEPGQPAPTDGVVHIGVCP